MPYVNIRITREGATPEQKARLIAGVTDLLVDVLDKSPQTTFVIIDEVPMEDWGIGGLPVEAFRRKALNMTADDTALRVNADFARRAVAHAARMEWVPSPVPGVERKLLDRIGGEVARATSIVRYAPGSAFPAHTHGGGEEFLVLDGVFQDEDGDYPAGSYVRNPPGSRHAPGSASGCTIFVKLRQFAAGDRERVKRVVGPAGSDAVQELFRNAQEHVRIERWPPGAARGGVAAGGLELLCLEGGFAEGGEAFGTGSWLRLPAGAALDAAAGPQGCRLWIKEGHLRHAQARR